jgi:hypothetical protein
MANSITHKDKTPVDNLSYRPVAVLASALININNRKTKPRTPAPIENKLNHISVGLRLRNMPHTIDEAMSATKPTPDDTLCNF